MPTPYGHALAGGILYLLWNRGPRSGVPAHPGPEAGSGWQRIALYAFIACAPDLDLLLDLWVGVQNAYHHGASHSLGAAAIAGLLAAVFARPAGWRPVRTSVIAFSLYASHVLLDYFAVDTGPPIGLKALWPLSDGYVIASVPVFLDVWRWPVSGEMVRHNLLTVMVETIILVPLFAALLYDRHRREQGAVPAQGAIPGGTGRSAREGD